MFLQNVHIKQRFAIGFVQVAPLPAAPLPAPPLVYILQDAYLHTNATLHECSIVNHL